MAQEPHKDGVPHLHVYLNYHKKVEWSSSKWDIDGHHGHYLPAKSPRGVVGYCTKGANWISNFDVQALIHKKASGRRDYSDLNKRCAEEDLAVLCDEGLFPFYLLPKYQQAKTAYVAQMAPKLPRCDGWIPNTLGKLLLVMPRTYKCRHFWIWSRRPNSGKTTFLLSVESRFPSYFYNFAEGFQSIQSRTQFLLLDEYSTAYLKLTDLNRMCDGTAKYPVKGGEAVMVRDHQIIICSNKPPEEVYTTPENWPLINARFVVFEL